jgi:hypothetical protein
MPELGSTKTLPFGTVLSPVNHANPGAPSMGTGRSSSREPYDDLALPSGSTVGMTSNEELRNQLAKLGIEGAHTDGRNVIGARQQF